MLMALETITIFEDRIILITKMFGPKQKGIKQQLVALIPS